MVRATLCRYVSNILGKVGTPCKNVTIRNCNLTGNYRNAVSVISVAGLVVQNTVLALSKGTPPEGGIDIEPNSPENLLQSILLENVTIYGNALRSLTVSMHALLSNASFQPVDITVKNTTILSGGSFGISINNGKHGVPIGSTLEFQHVAVSNTNGSGLLLEDKHPNLAVAVRDSTFAFNGVAGGNAPIWIEGRNSPCDGATFTNVTVIDSRATAPVAFMGVVRNMAGNINVKNPHCSGPESPPPGNSLVIACAK
jgi:hypothetical protein